jgi:hypothetical protein
MQFIPTGRLTLEQAIDRLMEVQAPGLSQQIARKRREIQQLEATHPPSPKLPEPIRSITDRGARGTPESVETFAQQAQLRADQKKAYDTFRARLKLLREELRKDQATWAAERERAIVRLQQTAGQLGHPL